MAKQVFQQLSAEFRSEWCKHGRATFNVEIFAPSRISIGVLPEDELPYDDDRYELIAQVALPRDSSREITPDGNNSTIFGYGVIERREGNTEARESFKLLCAKSGAAIPCEIRDHLAGLCHWHMPEPGSWWLALLVYLERVGAYWPDGRYRGHALITRPFLKSVNAIEQCRLDTDFPELPVFIDDFTTTDEQGHSEGLTTDSDDSDSSPETSGPTKESGHDRNGLSDENSPNDNNPSWDKESSELWFRGKMVRKVRPTARNLICILDVFEEESWSSRIDDPLDPSPETRRLSETIQTLNRNLTDIRFKADGSGEGVVWERRDGQ